MDLGISVRNIKEVKIKRGRYGMNVRRANEKDIPRLLELLQQVLEIHAEI